VQCETTSYEVDPLVCTRCGGEVRVITVILDPVVIMKILDHIRKKESGDRDPADAHPVAAAS